MSTQESEDFDYNRILTNDDGSGLFSLKFGDEEMASTVESKLSSKQTQPTSSGTMMTPSGSGEKRQVSDDVGPVRRLNEKMTHLGSMGMESIALSNYELSKSINRQADEVFRKDFPVIEPSADDASSEERERVEDWFRSMNDAGQTFHGLLKLVLQDHARLGTGIIIARKRYTVMDGDVIDVSLQEFTKGDPKVVRPITDEHNNIGGLYACPQHRSVVRESPGACPECDADLREATYAKTDGVNSNNVKTVFFDDEVTSFSFYNTRLHGRDGLSPVAGVWKQAYILDQMRNYTGKFFDDSTGNRYPDKMLFVTTSNADAFEKRAKQAKDNRQESPYEQGVLFFENTELDVQVVDMMSSEIMGQSANIKADYKNAIRTAFGLTDVIDSDEDSASLASGSKGVDVMSRSIEALRTDLEREVLAEIEDALQMEDWSLTFEEERTEETEMTGLEMAEMIQRLEETGTAYRVENGVPVIVDTDEEIDADSEQTENESSESTDVDVSL